MRQQPFVRVKSQEDGNSETCVVWSFLLGAALRGHTIGKVLKNKCQNWKWMSFMSSNNKKWWMEDKH